MGSDCISSGSLLIFLLCKYYPPDVFTDVIICGGYTSSTNTLNILNLFNINQVSILFLPQNWHFLQKCTLDPFPHPPYFQHEIPCSPTPVFKVWLPTCLLNIYTIKYLKAMIMIMYMGPGIKWGEQKYLSCILSANFYLQLKLKNLLAYSYCPD